MSRLIDYFETDPAIDATKVGVQGHSRYGKATLVATAYDDRIAASFPSAAGECGTSWMRRTYGESLEWVAGTDGEYHWLAGNAMRYMGELHRGRYWPRKVENLPVDVHCVLALVAPRPVLEACGVGFPWLDPRGEYLSGKFASEVWEFLGWPGQIIPPGLTFTSGPFEAVGGTPPIDGTYLDGTIGWRRHHQGHTPYPDWPYFVQFSARYLDDSRPVVTPRQRFTAGHGRGHRSVVGTVKATQADNSALGNWQITGGSGVGNFTIDRDSGQITIADHSPLRAGRYTLSVIVDDRKLTSKSETVVIDVPGHGHRH